MGAVIFVSPPDLGGLLSMAMELWCLKPGLGGTLPVYLTTGLPGHSLADGLLALEPTPTASHSLVLTTNYTVDTYFQKCV